ncbi:MAG TPA: kelch repeat-containing protein, partial [Candidatus Udaeobacter sp.]|nr:kelch repeat-containing protein [Candidatus Udaeobacter sp.]
MAGAQSIRATLSESSAAPNDTSWVPTGRLVTPRYNHTATLLTNGQVLVAGGDRPGGPRLPSAELYGQAAFLGGPATGGWNNTNSLANPRSNHTATLLPNGKVLVAGGDGAGTSAELYDPATGSWSSTGSLGTARSRHTATLLTSGKVLVAGGDGASTNAEVYDPATGNWSTTGFLATARFNHTATLLPS